MIRNKLTALAALPLLALAAATTATAADLTVSQKDKQFQPGALTVAAGDAVVFSNDDSATHNVMSTSKGNAFNLGAQKPGDSTEVVFKAPGAVDVICAIHPKMKMVVTVE